MMGMLKDIMMVENLGAMNYRYVDLEIIEEQDDLPTIYRLEYDFGPCTRCQGCGQGGYYVMSFEPEFIEHLAKYEKQLISERDSLFADYAKKRHRVVEISKLLDEFRIENAH